MKSAWLLAVTCLLVAVTTLPADVDADPYLDEGKNKHKNNSCLLLRYGNIKFYVPYVGIMLHSQLFRKKLLHKY